MTPPAPAPTLSGNAALAAALDEAADAERGNLAHELAAALAAECEVSAAPAAAELTKALRAAEAALAAASELDFPAKTVAHFNGRFVDDADGAASEAVAFAAELAGKAAAACAKKAPDHKTPGRCEAGSAALAFAEAAEAAGRAAELLQALDALASE